MCRGPLVASYTMNKDMASVASNLEDCVIAIASKVHEEVAAPAPPLKQQSPRYGKASKSKQRHPSVTALVVHHDAGRILEYLTAQDSKHLDLLAAAVAKGMKEVFRDGRVTIGDVPAVLCMIREITREVNAMHSKKRAAVKLAAASIIPLLRAVVCIVCEIFLPSLEYDLAIVIVNAAFSLLEMNVLPVLQKHLFQCCFADTTA